MFSLVEEYRISIDIDKKERNCPLNFSIKVVLPAKKILLRQRNHAIIGDVCSRMYP